MQLLLNTIWIRFSNSLAVFGVAHFRWSFVAFALPLLVVWLSQVSPVAGQDLKSMPWMDHDSGEIAPVGVEARDPSLTRDRDLIPKKKIKKVAPATTTTTWNPRLNANWAALGPVMVYGLVIFGALLLIGLVIWVFMNSRVDMGPSTVSSRSDRSLAESIRHLPFEIDVKKGDFRQQARAAYEAGDFRMALIFLFSHVLVTLDQAKLVRLKKGKTNRQYLRELSPNRPLVDYYGDVMVPFEQTFFGDYPITKEVFEGCWQGLEDFQSEVDVARANAARSSSVLTNIVSASAGAEVVGVSVAEGQGGNV